MITLYRPDLILHLQELVSQYLVLWSLHLGFMLGDISVALWVAYPNW